MKKLMQSLSCAIGLSALMSCSIMSPAITPATDNIELTVFSLNDFHGNLQADHPIPYLAHVEQFPEHEHAKEDAHGETSHSDTHQTITVAAGGYAYLTSLLAERKKIAGAASILVGAGDLIGASPIGSALLEDEPSLDAMNQLGMAVSAVGNHEFDQGKDQLDAKIHGKCPVKGCSTPGFSGAHFNYLGANVIDTATGKPWLPPYEIKTVAGLRIAFVGAVTKDTPSIVIKEAIAGLRFDDEAEAINRTIPELQKQGVNLIIALIHEGGSFSGPATDPSYLCSGLSGRIIDIANRLDPAVDMIISGHTHQGYTCKINGRLVVQARSYGAMFTESHLTFSRKQNKLIHADAVNYLVDQRTVLPDPTAQHLVDQVATLTDVIRQRPVTRLSHPLRRMASKPHLDSPLGNVIADAQLGYARRYGADRYGVADFAITNSGGVRSDLPSVAANTAVDVTYGDVYATQPFHNHLVAMTLTGQQVRDLLQQQWQDTTSDKPSLLIVSSTLSFGWRSSAKAADRLVNIMIHGQPIDLKKSYRVVANAFLADGGGGFTVLRQGTHREMLGLDSAALEDYLHLGGAAETVPQPQRITRLD